MTWFGLMRMRGLYGSKDGSHIVCQDCCARDGGEGGEIEEGEGWKIMVVVDAESGLNDMFEVENDCIWCVWYLNFNHCTVSKISKLKRGGTNLQVLEMQMDWIFCPVSANYYQAKYSSTLLLLFGVCTWKSSGEVMCIQSLR